MTVWVDNAAVLFRGKPRFHLAASSLPELHAFAERAGVRRCWFHPGQRPHYDITEEQRARALDLGAVPVSPRTLVRLLQKTLH